MFAFNPLASILSNNRLDETNNVSWKRNLNIVLTYEGIIWVTLEPLHVAPTESLTPEERADYEAWRKDDDKARMYILASLNEVLQCDAPNSGCPLTTRQPAETLVNVG